MEKVEYWKCGQCGSVWPAATTIEAWSNYKRVNQNHPGIKCQKENKS